MTPGSCGARGRKANRLDDRCGSGYFVSWGGGTVAA